MALWVGLGDHRVVGDPHRLGEGGAHGLDLGFGHGHPDGMLGHEDAPRGLGSRHGRKVGVLCGRDPVTHHKHSMSAGHRVGRERHGVLVAVVTDAPVTHAADPAGRALGEMIALRRRLRSALFAITVRIDRAAAVDARANGRRTVESGVARHLHRSRDRGVLGRFLGTDLGRGQRGATAFTEGLPVRHRGGAGGTDGQVVTHRKLHFLSRLARSISSTRRVGSWRASVR